MIVDRRLLPDKAALKAAMASSLGANTSRRLFRLCWPIIASRKTPPAQIDRRCQQKCIFVWTVRPSREPTCSHPAAHGEPCMGSPYEGGGGVGGCGGSCRLAVYWSESAQDMSY